MQYRQCNTWPGVLWLRSFLLELPQNGIPVPKRVGVLIFVMNCTSLSAFVGDCKNVRGMSNVRLPSTVTFYLNRMSPLIHCRISTVLRISISATVLLRDISWHPSACPDSFLYTMFTHRLSFTYFPNRSFVVSLISDTTQVQRVLKAYLNKTLKTREKRRRGRRGG